MDVPTGLGNNAKKKKAFCSRDWDNVARDQKPREDSATVHKAMGGHRDLKVQIMERAWNKTQACTPPETPHLTPRYWGCKTSIVCKCQQAFPHPGKWGCTFMQRFWLSKGMPDLYRWIKSQPWCWVQQEVCFWDGIDEEDLQGCSLAFLNRGRWVILPPGIMFERQCPVGAALDGIKGHAEQHLADFIQRVLPMCSRLM